MRRIDVIKAKDLEPKSGKMSKAERLALLDELVRLHNSQHTAFMEKAKRLKEAIASDKEN